ncbi:MAG TPA: glucose-6-phosphate dehydrogenase [Gallionella sp.]|nr:glucose-6-phosphate dehydrogenase [Gallionella sp.]
MNETNSDALVLFGATGDLAYKRIFPSLQKLVAHQRLDIPVIGVARAGWDLEQFRQRVRDSLEKHGGIDEAAFAKLSGLLKYVDGDYRDAATYAKLREALGPALRPLHYLAIPPSMFATVAEALSQSGCISAARVVVEKPFGRDLQSARELNRILHQFFPEQSIFRIDHFLGKEPVQNILYTRFANWFLESIWNRDHIRCMQITMAEDFGVQGRGLFYEEVGAIRDVIQNHLLQVLACLTMDHPRGEDLDALRNEQARLLKAVRPLAATDVVRGQFRGYRQEPGVAPDSNVETFAALRLFIDSWRWADVPFYIRAGKSLPASATEVVVEFKRPPRELFGEMVPGLSNHLRLRLSPEVVIGLGVRVKLPGERMVGEDVELIATHQRGDEMLPYERLLGDALRGDAALFAREDVVEAQWRIVAPVIGNNTPLYEYQPHTWGPTESEQLIAGDCGWFNPQPGSSS